MDEEKVPMKGHYLMYNKDILERVARVIKPESEGELTDEDREKAKEYIENESK